MNDTLAFGARKPKPGDQMWFTNQNGHDHQRDAAAKVFDPAFSYTVKDVDVSESSHQIQFEEAPGWHNGVMFSFTDPLASGRVGYERQGSGYDPGATGYELQGRDAAPARIALADDVLAKKPSRAERGEVIGSGIIVAKRNSAGRLIATNRPFEHPTREAALAEAKRLAELHTGTVFVVLVAVESFLVDKVK